ncbi:hypothetical protein B795N_01490 [Marinilactibacillus psychrotolerans]|uniref:polysaccharide pyruvyl transferase family protein n=1 Tax=Marinilactibacillus psychrotolerans TaxID=191770 RepID=UPI001C7D3AFE|nr:polysaccharide pyruvyl transferase family protein [Marinilactibacillus psychrotolerans]GEQ32267.1 hypothetical protein B795N_01490 [Marinilactibacillus psychrotolerans]
MKSNSNKYFIALTGAKKNVGDFLITERAIALLEKIAPEYEFIKYNHWEAFKDMNLINGSQGIIILGGPGYQMNMYPGVYKLRKDFTEIKVPIYTLGSGWKGKPGDRTTEKLYKFTDSAKFLLNSMEKTFAGMSCRDHQTVRALTNNGYKNITMTGCPVWYDLQSLGKEFQAPQKLNKIVFTPAQDYVYSDQSIEIMNYLKERFNDSKIIVSFHRGIGEVDEFTPESDAINTKKLANHASDLGYEVVNVSYDTNKLKFYNDCDLHIGYRVHAHIYFLSKRLPSILIHEDGRGNGVTEALNSPGIDAYTVSTIFSRLFGVFNTNDFLAKAYGRIGLKLNMNIINELDSTLNNIQNSNYATYQKTSKFIDEHYKVMEGFIKKMIYGKGAL